MDKIIEQAKCGNQLAIEQISAQYKGLIRSYANKFYLVGGDKEDLLQEGMLGLYFAVINYDEEKGSFPAFVELCVLRQILDAVKRDNGAKNKPLYNYVDIDEVRNVITDSSTPLENLLRKEHAERVAHIIETKLTPTEKQVIKLFSEGYSYEDISEKLGKSYKAVDGALQRARKKLLVTKE